MEQGPPYFSRRGIQLALSSPSGAGKSTIARGLLSSDPELRRSISATTRPVRNGEINGEDYHFVGIDGFRTIMENGGFLEWVQIAGHFYGTPRAAAEQMLSTGKDVLFDIDWQGAQQLFHASESNVVRVFIFPPSMDELRRRLIHQQRDPVDNTDTRIARAFGEINHWDGYDYVLVNDEIDQCVERFRNILMAERLKRARQVRLPEFIRQLNNNDETHII